MGRTETERELLDRAWYAIAHAGSWGVADPDWKAAAERWRDDYHRYLARTGPAGSQPHREETWNPPG